MLTIPDDQHFMRQALREAQTAYEEGEVPIGCVIAKEGKVIGRGHNRMEGLKDCTAHAEILALGAASGALGNWRLDGCTLYATLEPCPMCAGAILNGRVAKVVYGSRDKRLGALGSAYDILAGNPLNREIEVVGDVLGEECLNLLKAFFQDLRKRPKTAAEDSSESIP
jgi:tRNA(adenine34) deaminase